MSGILSVEIGMNNIMKHEKKNIFGIKLQHDLVPYIMLVPGFAGILFVNLIPSIRALVMGFYTNNFTPRIRFVGLQKFARVLSYREFWQVLGNTFFWSLATIACATTLGIIAASLLNRKLPGRKFFRTIFLVPWVTPPVVSSMVWKTIFNETLSPINDILLQLQLIQKPIGFLSNPSWRIGPLTTPMLSLLVVNIWNVFPFMMVMVLAAMQSVDVACYEAATIDGAGRMRQFFSITLPLIMPVLSISILLQGIWQFNSFNFNYLITYGGPLNTTKTMAVMIYQKAFSEFDYGQAGALSAMMLACVLIPAVIYIKQQLSSINQ